MTQLENVADTWLYTTLSGDATLTGYVGTQIHAETAPDDATYPLVRYTMISSNDRLVGGGARLWLDALYLVEVIARSESYGGALAAAYGRVDALLHAQRGTVSGGGEVHACYREEHRRSSNKEADGKIYRRLGGVYRILAST
jgi:hypothetical protein